MRIFVTIIALLVAAPGAVNAAAFTLKGVERLAPTQCCCAGDEEEHEPELSFEALCCCDLTVPNAGHDLRGVALLASDSSQAPAPSLLLCSQPLIGRAQAASLPSFWARGPPPKHSLYSQRTSLLC